MNENYNSYVNQGIALFKIKKYEEAIECYDEAIKINSSSSDVYIHKGDAVFQLDTYNNHSLAINLYKKAKEIDPNNSQADEKINYMMEMIHRMLF